MLIFNYKPYYRVEIDENNGAVKVFSNSAHAKGRELTQRLNIDGYLLCKMDNQNIFIHFLVAKFVLGDRPKGLCINHKDGNKLNNRPSNLEYVTIAENIRHSIQYGMHVSNDPKRSGRYKDGRAVNINEYKKAWYQQNRVQILKKAKESYLKKI